MSFDVIIDAVCKKIAIREQGVMFQPKSPKNLS